MHASNRSRGRLAAGSIAFAALIAGASLAGCSPDGQAGGQLGSAASELEIMAIGSALPETASSCPPPYPYNPSPSPGGTEEYRALDEPGFLSPATSPLSTLSADVDTASYCNLRRMVAQEYAPAVVPAGAVRTEELLNYFDYAYPAPVGSDLFGVSTQMSDCPWNDQTKLLVMGFATEKDGDASSAGANLVFLIDVSGSMDDPDKLPLVKDSFATLVEGLTERDRVSVVTYASGERVLLEGVPGDDKRRIMRAVDGLVAEGSTNGEAGLEQAYRLAESSFIEGGVNRVVMASDGDLNVGISSESELHDFVERKRETGVYLSVLGFGSGNYKDNKMETLADHGNGAYHYVDCAEEARRVLGRNLRANLVPLADDVKIQVEFNPDRVKGYRLIGYENRALADEEFRDDAADAGEVGAGHAFTVAYEIVPAGSAFEAGASALKYGSDADDRQDGRRSEANDGEWLTCTMRYRPAGTVEAVEQALVVDDESCTDARTEIGRSPPPSSSAAWRCTARPMPVPPPSKAPATCWQAASSPTSSKASKPSSPTSPAGSAARRASAGSRRARRPVRQGASREDARPARREP